MNARQSNNGMYRTEIIRPEIQEAAETAGAELAGLPHGQLLSVAVSQLLSDLRHLFADEELSRALHGRLLHRLSERWNDAPAWHCRQQLASAAGRELCQLAAEQYEQLLGLLDLRPVHDDPVWDGEPPPDHELTEQALRAARLQSLCAAIRSNLQPDEWWLFRRRCLQNADWQELAAEMQLSTAEIERRYWEAVSSLRPRLHRYHLWLRLRPR